MTVVAARSGGCATFASVDAEQRRKQVGLPSRPFLYTLDQIGVLLSLEPETLKRRYIHFAGRTVGKHDKQMLRAVNISPRHTTPEWRVDERELVRWMRVMGFRYYETRGR